MNERDYMSDDQSFGIRKPSKTDAGTGLGTSHGIPLDSGEQTRPVLDGSTLTPAEEAQVKNPTRGQADPASEGKQEALNTASTTRWIVVSNIAAVIMLATLLIFFGEQPVLNGIGAVVILLALLASLIVRSSGAARRKRLLSTSILLAIIWVVPLAIYIIAVIRMAFRLSVN